MGIVIEEVVKNFHSI